MNSYADIIAAGDKLLRKRGVSDDARQVAALVVALAHRAEKDAKGLDGGAPSKKTSTASAARTPR